MNKIKFLTVSIMVIVLMGTGILCAQPGVQRNEGFGLTTEQLKKIKDIRLASYKEIKVLRNQLGELKAKERTLTTADKPDMDAINSNIDDITKVQSKIMKIKAADLQQIRGLLTDEQKMWFDSRKEMKMHKGAAWHGMDMREGGWGKMEMNRGHREGMRMNRGEGDFKGRFNRRDSTQFHNDSIQNHHDTMQSHSDSTQNSL